MLYTIATTGGEARWYVHN